MNIAPSAPPHCASCFDQKPRERHIDFQAAYDGPVIPGGQPTPIDDLIICESCLRQAARLIGLQDWSDIHDRMARAETQRDDLEAKLVEANTHIRDLTAALDSKPQRSTGKGRRQAVAA